MSLHRFVTWRRIHGAIAMLQEPSPPIAVIADDLCFSPHGHFTRLFTKTTGMTPAKCREQVRPVIG